MNKATQYSNKLKNLILYVLSNENYREEGIKKLNKILYFIDFYFYREKEHFISGNTSYAKADMGPVIDNYRTIFGQLVTDKVLCKDNSCGPIVHKPIENFDPSAFSSEEIIHINNILDRFGKLSSSELELISHQQQPWVLTKDFGDIIDPDLALLIDDGEVEESEILNDDLKNEVIGLANEYDK
ncbi:MAG: type II toxin-antitoxin system antitoxin SocA domain-containing protein [Patescibacteria group bacterium]